MREDLTNPAPPGMPTEQFSEKIAAVVALREDLHAAECVTEYDVGTLKNGRVAGRARLTTTELLHEFNEVLDDYGLSVDSLNSSHPAFHSDGTPMTIGVTFSE